MAFHKPSTVRSAALRRRALSLAKACSIGLRSASRAASNAARRRAPGSPRGRRRLCGRGGCPSRRCRPAPALVPASARSRRGRSCRSWHRRGRRGRRSRAWSAHRRRSCSSNGHAGSGRPGACRAGCGRSAAPCWWRRRSRPRTPAAPGSSRSAWRASRPAARQRRAGPAPPRAPTFFERQPEPGQRLCIRPRLAVMPWFAKSQPAARPASRPAATPPRPRSPRGDPRA